MTLVIREFATLIPHRSVLLALGALALPATVLAEPPAPPAPPPGDTTDHWRRPPMGEEPMAGHARAHEAQRMKALHEVLRIRPDQEGAFQAFVAAMSPAPHPTGPDRGAGEGGHADMAQLTTPQRLDRMAQMMDARMSRMRAQFQRRADATKALYAALGPEQQRTLDALPALGGGMGGELGHGWGGHEMGHGGPDGGRPPMGPPPQQGD